MVGLPGQTITSLANDILLMKELSLDMAGIGPFLPHPATPPGGSPGRNHGNDAKSIGSNQVAAAQNPSAGYHGLWVQYRRTDVGLDSWPGPMC